MNNLRERGYRLNLFTTNVTSFNKFHAYYTHKNGFRGLSQFANTIEGVIKLAVRQVPPESTEKIVEKLMIEDYELKITMTTDFRFLATFYSESITSYAPSDTIDEAIRLAAKGIL